VVRSGRGWAGPPPLLLLATVLGVLAAPLVDSGPTAAAPGASAPAAATLVSPRVVEPRIVRPVRSGDAALGRAGRAGTGVAPVRLAPLDIGVASFNMFQQLTAEQAAADARRLTAHPRVDIVGWQEAGGFVGQLDALPGWTTRSFALGNRPAGIAISWRTRHFTLVKAARHRVANGVSSIEGRYPFAARLVVVVTLRHRESGRLITVVNTHLPQKMEDLDAPGTWAETINAGRGRQQLARIAQIWRRAGSGTVVGTGDYNFDARSDALRQPEGGPIRSLRGTALSSYQALSPDVGPTHPPTGRNIDYVWADARQVAAGEVEVRSHRVLAGYASDHRPILARLRITGD